MRGALVVVAILGIAGVAGGCGGHPPIPTRGVVEADLGSWRFRRFQGPLLDVEVWIDGNKGEAFSASYITNDAEKRGHIDEKDLVNVTVTRYERPEGVVRETVKLVRRLAQEKGYQVDENKIGGIRALSIVGPGEAWVMWPSKNHVVKVGGQGRKDVPSSMVQSYGDRYPSQLPGGSLEGPLPAGPEGKPNTGPDKPAYDPNNPTPDIDHYDPNKVKVPDGTSTDPKPEAVPDDAKPEPKTTPTSKPKPKPTAKQKKAT